MDYTVKRAEAIARLGPEGVQRLLESQAGFRFVGNRSAKNVQFHLDIHDENPSGSLCIEKGVTYNFVTAGGECIEYSIGNGNKPLGAKLLLREAQIPIKDSPQFRNTIARFDFDEVLKEPMIPHEIQARADVIFSQLRTDCVAYLQSADAAIPMIQYLTAIRQIPISIATHRGFGLVPRGRLAQLVADLTQIDFPTDNFQAFVRGGYSDFLIWLPEIHGKPTAIRLRGLPKPGTKNPKNMWTFNIRNGEQGYTGSIDKDGTLFVFEGEFNQLQADKSNGSPLNSVAVGSAGTGQKLAKHLHEKSEDIVVIGDDDVAGRKMVQAIADVAPIRVIFAPNGEDADEYLKHSSWTSLLALAKQMMPSWNGFRERLKPMLALQSNESQKQQITSLIFEALKQKGRILRTTRGECLYIED
jgi:hypothetical protein